MPPHASRRDVPDIARLPLVRLLQLASPTLPIGAYSYSQGLEWAVEAGEIRDAAGAQAWIGDVLRVGRGARRSRGMLAVARSGAERRLAAARDVEFVVQGDARNGRAARGNRADRWLAP